MTKLTLDPLNPVDCQLSCVERPIESAWINPPEPRLELPQIILELDPSEAGKWHLYESISEPKNLNNSHLDLAKPSTSTTDSIVSKSVDFGLQALVSPGGWAVGGLLVVAVISWTIDRRIGQFVKSGALGKAVASVTSYIVESRRVLEEIREGGKYHRQSNEEIMDRLDRIEQQSAIKHREVQQIKTFSQPNGEDLSGQLGELKSELKEIKSKILYGQNNNETTKSTHD